MSNQHQYLVCSQRPGSPRVALEVCRICRKAKRCQAWRDYNYPGFFPGLAAPPPRSSRRPAGLSAAKPVPALAQAILPFAL